MNEKIEKWRDSLFDPFGINFENIVIDEVISYPPAGNDVLECIGKYKGKKSHFFLKLERSKMANFDNEVKILNLVNDEVKSPIVYEFGVFDNYRYIAISAIEGNRLSDILNNSNDSSLDYMENYGAELAHIHSLNIKTNNAMQRPINDIPTNDIYKKFDDFSNNIIDILLNSKPVISFDTFIHGDFHYANIMWKNKKISGVLDWEYSGIGFKEQDIAWALILRPTQKFLDTFEEISLFLKGYKTIGNYDSDKLKWCLLNGYIHFYLMNMNNEEYKNKIKTLIEDIQKRL